MNGKFSRACKTIFILAALMASFIAGGALLVKDSSKAFGGNFAPQMSQPGARYQIAGCDGSSAWIIDTTVGDVYLIFSNGKWKEVGSITDEKKRIKK
jgi:hypothetical protein